MKLAVPLSILDQHPIALRVALAVQAEEYALGQKLGADALEAHGLSWAAYDCVIEIARNPAPAIYQTTEAKTITGKKQ